MDGCSEPVLNFAERWDDGCHRIERANGLTLPTLWGDALPHLVRAVERSYRYPHAYALLEELREGTKQLWVIYELAPDTLIAEAAVACVITSLHDYDAGRMCRIVTCSGHGWQQWADMGLDAIEDWARQAGAVRMIPLGRPGWKSVFERRGYKMTHVQMERAL